MEHRENEAGGQTENTGLKQDREGPRVAPDTLHSGGAGRPSRAEKNRTPLAQSSRLPARSWVNWQSALYVFVLGLTCVFLAPLTGLWWLVLVLGAAVPIALATLDGPGLASRRAEDKKAKERELLEALAERGGLTSTTAAMRTSLTVDQASKMLEELARKGHLRPQADEGVMSYALRARDRYETPDDVLEAPESEGEGAPHRPAAQKRLDDPLSEREIEVLGLLASGRTNSEIARDLFISVGTVKSHTGNIYRKLGARNRAEALALARDLELLQ